MAIKYATQIPFPASETSRFQVYCKVIHLVIHLEDQVSGRHWEAIGSFSIACILRPTTTELFSISCLLNTNLCISVLL